MRPGYTVALGVVYMLVAVDCVAAGHAWGAIPMSFAAGMQFVIFWEYRK